MQSQMSQTLEDSPQVCEFLAQLEVITWFSSIGKPAFAESDVKRICGWNEWPGPQEPAIHELSLRHQSLHDSILDNAGNEEERFTRLWDRIQRIVLRVAAPKVPYDPNQDTWHASTTAVWQAAWTAGLIGLCIHSGRSIPRDLQEQWQWYLRGHWPSGYSNIGADGRPGPLLVY